MSTRAAFITLCGAALLACSSETPVEGEGGMVFVDGGSHVILDVTGATLETDDGLLFLHFALSSQDGEGTCDFESYQADAPGIYQMSAGGCDITAGDKSWRASPAEGEVKFQESSVQLDVKGLLYDGGKKGPIYKLNFSGTH